MPSNGNRILRLPTIPSSRGASFEDSSRSARTGAARRSRKTSPRGSGAARPANVLPIDDARGVRWDKVRSARSRIAVDYYDREEVKLQVLDAVLRELNRR